MLFVGPSPPTSPTSAAQTVWQIDPVKGSDRGTGLVGSPIQTVAELRRRVGTPWFVPVAQVDITILASVPATDPLYLEILPLVPSRVIFHGAPTVVYSKATGFSAATLLARGTQTRPTVTDAAAPWTANVNKLLVDTATNPSKYAFITADLGAGIARTSRWLQFDPLSTISTPTMVDQAVADPFQIVSYPSIACGVVNLADPLVSDAFTVFVTFENLQLGLDTGTQTFILAGSKRTRRCTLNNCILGRCTMLGGLVYMQNCNLLGSIRVRNGCNFALWGGVVSASTLLVESGQVELDFDPFFEGGALDLHENFNPNCYVGGAAFFRTTGDGLIINPGQTVFNTLNDSGVQAVWGTQAAGGAFGVRVRSGGKLVYNGAKPTVTGPGGDTNIGGTVTAYAGIPFVNAANQAAIIAYA